jgi:hypothetical protein
VTETETTTVTAPPSSTSGPPGPPCDVITNAAFETGDITGWTKHFHSDLVGYDDLGQVIPNQDLGGNFSWWSRENSFSGLEQKFTPCPNTCNNQPKPSMYYVAWYRAWSGLGVCTFRMCYITDDGMDLTESRCTDTWGTQIKTSRWNQVSLTIPFNSIRPGDYTIYFEAHCDGDDQVLVDNIMIGTL